MKALFTLEIKDRHRQLMHLVKENRGRYYLTIFFMIALALSEGWIALLIKPVVDIIFVQNDPSALISLPVKVFLAFLAKSISMLGNDYMLGYIGQNIIRKLRNRLYERIQQMPLAFFQQEKTGTLMSRITNDVNLIKNMVSSVITGSLRDILRIVVLTSIIFYHDWQSALGAILILPVAYYPIVVFGRKVRRASKSSQESMADLNAFLHETIAGNKIVKAFCMEAYEQQRFVKSSYDLFKKELKIVIARSLSSPVMELLAGTFVAFIIFYAGSKVVRGETTAGTFCSFMGAVLMLYEPIKRLTKLNNAVQQGLAGTDRVFDIIERDAGIKELPQPRHLVPGPHRIALENVVFKYDRDPVLKGINLQVEPGEVVALVGMSGGGKTSLVNLIPRFFDVNQGAVKIDGVDIREYALDSLRSQIAVVTQEPILFNDTIRGNIAYGNPGADDADLVKAAKAAYAYDYIQSFPKKFDTTIGELGGRLSGGEKQRLCIARALLKDAPILILDEATSSLDTEAESLVQKALENLMRGRTTFVIAHRLSTISNAHRIVVLVDGRIVEEGRHEELIELQREYYKLYQMQFDLHTKAI